MSSLSSCSASVQTSRAASGCAGSCTNGVCPYATSCCFFSLSQDFSPVLMFAPRRQRKLAASLMQGKQLLFHRVAQTAQNAPFSQGQGNNNININILFLVR